jgi:hypothetical protein
VKSNNDQSLNIDIIILKLLGVAQTNKNNWNAQELASVGELLLDISTQLTKK